MKTYSAHFYIVHKPPFGPVPETSLSIEEKPVTKMSATQKPAIASNESSGNSSNSESDVESISEQENQKKKRIEPTVMNKRQTSNTKSQGNSVGGDLCRPTSSSDVHSSGHKRKTQSKFTYKIVKIFYCNIFLVS